MRLYIPENQQFGSTSTLFSTAVISGSSSTPNLQDNVVIDAPGQPTIRPLETLHNALSLRYLSEFLDKMITSPWYRFPCSPSKSPMPVLMPMPSMEQSDLLSVVPLSDKFESNLQVVHNNQRQQQQRKQPQSEHDDISECFHSSDHS